MTRVYGTPAAFRQALESRLRERSAEDGVALARLRQLLVFDRFLARVSAVFGDRVTLKGGLVIEHRLHRARTTKDVDLQILASPGSVLERLRDAGRTDLGDFLRFEVGEDPRHHAIQAEGMLYQGRRFRARALLAGKLYGSPFGVDVAFAEPMTGVVERVRGTDLLSFAGVEPPTFRIYPVEAHIAEKLHAYTLPRAALNSRVKDLPDLALLGQVRRLEAASIREAIRETFAGRETHEPPASLPDAPSEWKPVYERMARLDDLPWPTLEALTDAVRAFIDPVLAGGSGRWSPEDWRWVPG